MKNRITALFDIQYPIIQAGMVWCSGWRLASAVSEAGGLGLIGAGSMSPELLREHIRKCREATTATFGVNVPLLYARVDEQISVIIEEKVPVVFTSAGNPANWTPVLKERGIRVAHVVSSGKFAVKAMKAGVDAVVAEGFEAGGHNGREETTTFCLIPGVRQRISIPLIAAGGVGSGRSMLAAMVLGAEGVQIGTRFAASIESSAHEEFKRRIVEVDEGGTMLSLKKLAPVRLIRNQFYEEVRRAEEAGSDRETLLKLLGAGRARKGMFEGDLEQGELEIGQVSAMIDNIKPAASILHEIWEEYLAANRELCSGAGDL